MNVGEINNTIHGYLNNQEIAGGALLVRRNGELVYENTWGWADIAAQRPIEEDAIYRMMSMTKPVTAAAVMQQVEQGKMGLDDPVSRWLPAFRSLRVVSDKRYEWHEGMNMLSLLPKLLFFRADGVKTVPAEREITIRDLLSHSSGLQQGIAGLLAYKKDTAVRESLETECEKYSRLFLDFQPGTGTSYSPLAGFDVLGRIVEISSGEALDSYMKKHIFTLLDMKDTTFRLTAEQETRLVRAYKRKNGRLTDVTGTKDDMDSMLHRGSGYVAASGGLFSTVQDYEHFARMLLDGGTWNGNQVLRPETVAQMSTEGALTHLETEPGCVWGLGVKIRQDPKKGGSSCTAGTYGWSGAFGTHFFVSPADKLEAVWCTNRTDLEGSGSYISKKIEDLVFGCFAGEAET